MNVMKFLQAQSNFWLTQTSNQPWTLVHEKALHLPESYVNSTDSLEDNIDLIEPAWSGIE